MRKVPTAVLLAVLAISGIAHAELVQVPVTLGSGNEVPPVQSPASATADVRLDTTTRQLSWTLKFSGLTTAATGAHFHGPAAPTANGGIIVPIAIGIAQAGEVSGSATLTEQQVADVLAGRWYINVHTPTYPAGELRGQVVRR